MLVINCIDCKYKEFIKLFLFAPSIFNESSTISNLTICKNLNIVEMSLD